MSGWWLKRKAPSAEPTPSTGYTVYFVANGDEGTTDGTLYSKDSTGTVTAVSSSGYTNEQAQDAVAGILLDSTSIDFTYDDITPTITADVKTNGIVNAMLADDAVNSSEIVANAVTNAKLAQIATATFKGRSTAGTGNVEDLSASTARTTMGLTFFATLANLTGDVTTSGTATATIANNAVSLAKMADIATDRLLGRDTASTGDPEVLTVTGGLEFTGSGGIQRSALTGDITATAGSNTTAIAAGVIVNADINASAAIALSKLATDPLARANHTGTQAATTVTVTPFATIAATTVQAALEEIVAEGGGGGGAASAVSFTPYGSIAATNVQNAIQEIVDEGGGGYDNEQAQDAVGGILTDTATIDFTYSDATPSITAAVIDDSITFAKMQNIATARVLGRVTASSGDIEELTASQVRTMLALVIGTDVQAWDADLDSWAGKTAPSGTAVGTTDTQTLTNKRITERSSSPAFSATPTINTDSLDCVELSGLSGAITSMTTNLTGTPTNFQNLVIRYKDDGTARAITHGASFAAGSVALPTTTVLGKWKTVVYQYFTSSSKWCSMSVLDEI